MSLGVVGVAVEEIVASAPTQLIGAIAAGKIVVPAAADEDVIALIAVEQVVPDTAGNVIVAGPGVKLQSLDAGY